MERKKLRKWCRNGFLIFLLAMAFFTVLSRSLDSLTIPRVGTSYAKMGNVTYEITGDGTFFAQEITYAATESGLKVQSVEKTAGQKVEAGDVLFRYQMEGIQEKKAALSLSLEKLKLELEQAKIMSRQIPGIPEETTAVQSLEAAQRALDFGRQDLEQLKLDSEEKLARLKRDFNQSMNQSEEEMEEETRRQYRNAERAYDAAVTRKENAVKRAEREAADCEETLERLKDEGASDEEIEKAEKALDRAEEDLNEVRIEQEILVEEAKAVFDSAEEDYGDVSAGRRTAAEALRSSYEAAVEAVNEQINAGERNIRSLEEAVRQAAQGVANAQARDGVTSAERQKEAAADSLEQQRKLLDIAEAEGELKALEELEAVSGAVRAPAAGMVTEITVVPGKPVTGDEIVAVGGGSFKFEGTVDKALSDKMAEGMKIHIQYGDYKKFYEATVDYVDYLSDEDQVRFTAVLAEETGALGVPASFQALVKSKQYNQVIPIAGLKQDSSGYYVLVVKPEKTILGEELRAERVPVELLEKSSSQAAVEGAFSVGDRLIVSGNRIIEPGDRVRIAGE